MARLRTRTTSGNGQAHGHERGQGEATRFQKTIRGGGRKFQSRHGNGMPRNGKVMPRESFEPSDVAKAQGEVLQLEYGRLASPAKELALDTGASERACRNHLNGINCMSLTEFFNACQSIPVLQAWGARMIGLKATNDPRFAEEWAEGVKHIKVSLDFNGVNFVPKVGEP